LGVCVVAGGLGALLMFLAMLGQFSLSQYWTQQAAVKGYVDRSYVGTYLSMFAYVALIAGATLRAYLKVSPLYVAIPLVEVSAFSLSFWGRAPIIIGLIMLSVVLVSPALLRSRRRKIKIGEVLRVALTALLCGGVLFCAACWTTQLRIASLPPNYDPYSPFTGAEVKETLNQVQPLIGSPRAALITYSYIANSICALDYWIARPSEYFLGQVSFPYFSRTLRKAGLLSGEDPIGDRTVTELGVQLPSILGYAYMDFGWTGVALFPFAICYTSSVCYRRFLNTPTVGRLFRLAYSYVLVVFSPWIFAFTWTEAVVIFFLVLLFARAFDSSPGVDARRSRRPRVREYHSAYPSRGQGLGVSRQPSRTTLRAAAIPTETH
jgi:hypothetical protein